MSQLGGKGAFLYCAQRPFFEYAERDQMGLDGNGQRYREGAAGGGERGRCCLWWGAPPMLSSPSLLCTLTAPKWSDSGYGEGWLGNAWGRGAALGAPPSTAVGNGAGGSCDEHGPSPDLAATSPTWKGRSLPLNSRVSTGCCEQGEGRGTRQSPPVTFLSLVISSFFLSRELCVRISVSLEFHLGGGNMTFIWYAYSSILCMPP